MSTTANQNHSAVLHGFLEVVSCAFGAMLVLGIVFSINRGAMPAEPTVMQHYQDFEFEAALIPPASGTGGASVRYGLEPVLRYQDESGWHEIEVESDPTAGYRVVPGQSLPFEVALTGFSIEPFEGALDAAPVPNPAGGDPSNGQWWAVLFTQVPEDMRCDAQIRYINVGGDREMPPLRVRRTCMPGTGQPQPPQDAPATLPTHFPAPTP